ncbi:oxidized low-density lipoprotein receptor 1-like [Mauremys reevesii]|uniref:oxidized low-density lipoprotein receptor 1-like n=1 Tax=Mauremys reevesii TaxID=260615 RepID=UPI00193FD981|nr:oxidized low-density lipoprotein receptor 1-like [Mauremys reevesii]
MCQKRMSEAGLDSPSKQMHPSCWGEHWELPLQPRFTILKRRGLLLVTCLSEKGVDCPATAAPDGFSFSSVEALCHNLWNPLLGFAGNIGLLGALVCRWQQNFSQQQGILENLTCQQINLENQTRELQEILENLAWERDHLQIQNTNFLKTLQSKGDKCIICPKTWIQNGKDCYELSSGIKSWSACKEYCSSLGSRLLKIDSKEDLDFIKPLTCFPYWMGLLYNETKGYWQWEDGFQV